MRDDSALNESTCISLSSGPLAKSRVVRCFGANEGDGDSLNRAYP